jgi:hypothetical protein
MPPQLLHCQVHRQHLMTSFFTANQKGWCIFTVSVTPMTYQDTSGQWTLCTLFFIYSPIVNQHSH